MSESCAHYRFDAWRVTQLDALARRALTALDAVQALDSPSNWSPADGRKFHRTSYHDEEIRTAQQALRAATRRLALWALAGVRAARPEPHVHSGGPSLETDRSSAETAMVRGLGELLRRAID